MSSSIFDLPFADLPQEVMLFPLTGALLLPFGLLPLNIFEPRYLNLFLDALKTERLVGMVQPVTPQEKAGSEELYRIGCLGRISRFEENDDDCLQIMLTGVCRFSILQELPLNQRGYRCVKVDFTDFSTDMNLLSPDETFIDRDNLLQALRIYFKAKDLTANWKAINQSNDQVLVTSLAMLCPFQPQEKQALLEVPSIRGRAEIITALLEINAHDSSENGPSVN